MVSEELPDKQAANLGKGMAFLTNWDFEVIGGSIELIDGLDVLGRDLAWALQTAIGGEYRGETLDTNTKEDIRIDVNNIVERDGRVDTAQIPTIRRADDAKRKVEVILTVTAITGDRGQYILKF